MVFTGNQELQKKAKNKKTENKNPCRDFWKAYFLNYLKLLR